MSTDMYELVNRAKQGDNAAFEVIYHLYQRIIFVFINQKIWDEDDAEDLTQECFIRAFEALPKTGDKLNFPAWLHRIARNACFDMLRRRQRSLCAWEGRKHDLLRLSPRSEEPESVAISHEIRIDVRLVLENMSSRHRVGLILHECEGMSCQEIGEVMGLPLPAVKSLLYRARAEFRLVYKLLVQYAA